MDADKHQRPKGRCDTQTKGLVRTMPVRRQDAPRERQEHSYIRRAHNTMSDTPNGRNKSRRTTSRLLEENDRTRVLPDVRHEERQVANAPRHILKDATIRLFSARDRLLFIALVIICQPWATTTKLGFQTNTTHNQHHTRIRPACLSFVHHGSGCASYAHAATTSDAQLAASA